MSRFNSNFVLENLQSTPFQNPTAINFFQSWCRVIDKIETQFLSRSEWEEKKLTAVFSQNENGHYTLFLPTDLQNWEVQEIVRIIDQNTYSENPSRISLQEEIKVRKAKILEKAGIYLAQHLYYFNDEDESERDVTKELSSSFYSAGLLLQGKVENHEASPITYDLSEKDINEVENWLLGDSKYNQIVATLSENPTHEEKENLRRKLFKKYIKLLASDPNNQQSIELYKKSDKEAPTQQRTPIEFQELIKQKIERVLQFEYIDLYAAISRRGTQNLVKNSKVGGAREVINRYMQKFGLEPIYNLPTLYDELDIKGLKEELDSIRATGNIEETTKKELEIGTKIQRAVSSLPFGDVKFPVNNILQNKHQCASISYLTTGLLKELGIKNRIILMPRHAAVALITSDNRVWYFESTTKLKLTLLSEDNVEINQKDVNSLSGEYEYLSIILHLSKINLQMYIFIIYICFIFSSKYKSHIFDSELGTLLILLNECEHDDLSMKVYNFELQKQICPNLFFRVRLAFALYKLNRIEESASVLLNTEEITDLPLSFNLKSRKLAYLLKSKYRDQKALSQSKST